MKRGHIYTLVFMVVITAVLVFALAAAYEGFKPAIQSNKSFEEQRAVLYALGLTDITEKDAVIAAYQEKISEEPINGQAEAYGRKILAHKEDGQVVSYAVPFEGAGLWGSIRGYLGMNADHSQATGLVFTYQNETPGLGGRIDEDWYKEQFRGIPLQPGQPIRYGMMGDKQLDAVTGATQTSKAVVNILNNLLESEVFVKEGN